MSVVLHCGMPSEKRILSAALPGLLILSGQDKLRLPELVPADCTRIVCIGLCGGLAPGYAVGDTAAAVWVIDRVGDLVIDCDADWIDEAITLDPNIKRAAWYSSGLMDEGDDPGQRAALWRRTGAECIDDESRFSAAEARRRDVPLNIVRSLSDAYDDDLPLMARYGVMNPDGSPNLAYIAGALGRDQGENSESVLTVTANYARSLEALDKTARALAPLLTRD